jgi:hypothetical protein
MTDREPQLPRMAIHGSCVSRDMLEVCGAADALVLYRARSALATKGTPPLRGPMPFLDRLGSAFNRRMLRQDLAKVPFAPVGADVVILDLIDERFGVLRCGASLVTDSNLFRESGADGTLDVQPAFERGSPEHLAQFRLGCEAFRTELTRVGLPVVVHSSRWATRYLPGDGDAPYEDPDVIARENDLLERLEGIVREVIAPDLVIAPDDRTVVATPDHRWGLAPYHYQDAYYHDVFGQLLTWWGSSPSTGHPSARPAAATHTHDQASTRGHGA